MQTLWIALSCLALSLACPDECAKGEHLWCGSLENAIKCSAVEHCLATVWTNDLLKENDGIDKCVLCVKFIRGTKEFFENKLMRKKVVEMMKDKICPLFGKFQSTCKLAVEHYANYFLDFLASRINPDKVCKLIHVCPNNGTIGQPFRLEDAERIDRSKVTCWTCKILIDMLKKFIGYEPTKETIEEALEKICSMMPESMRHVCDDFVKKYSEIIIKLLLENMDTVKICEAMHFCPDYVEGCPKKSVILDFFHTILSSSSDITSVDKCEVGEIIMALLEGLLDKNSTVEQVERAAQKICRFLPCQHKDFCDDLIKEDLPLIVEVVVKKIKPHESCELLNMCNVGKEKLYFMCVAGPKYWCASEANARLCEAEDHCRKFAWT